ncbi:DUF3267 domain-containing protein [Chitinophaga barathri]|uniref:DUF3267 domain-containing protein n=1 Tax=Chitinophaga barathri TaxID=1647451 RepID=A0A3N4MT87_9BACT|nr:DUF3267 domain-containing protein [Chitinophaga barathri]RPD38633.1 DUF3267 domain-containing protein [Chitinophaga barathri]
MMTGQLIQSLREQGYEEYSRFSFNELVIPLREGLKSGNIYATSFFVVILTGCGGMGALAAFFLLSDTLTGSQMAGWTLACIPATLLLVPLHELIHGWMFRWYGAKDVRYGVIWKKLMFYAVAHGFAVNYRQFRYIALAPFVVISLLLIAAFLLVTAPWKALILGVMVFHAMCCAGDFGLCAYFYQVRHRQPLSFDDADGDVTYFYTLPDLKTENP